MKEVFGSALGYDLVFRFDLAGSRGTTNYNRTGHKVNCEYLCACRKADRIRFATNSSRRTENSAYTSKTATSSCSRIVRLRVYTSLKGLWKRQENIPGPSDLTLTSIERDQVHFDGGASTGSGSSNSGFADELHFSGCHNGMVQAEFSQPSEKYDYFQRCCLRRLATPVASTRSFYRNEIFARQKGGTTGACLPHTSHAERKTSPGNRRKRSHPS
ncbi:hypothetical protein AVEN_200785-1 [Araneus ventricosus]|uniref:Uncharacterized protein n=1 Tax=Araneus ventricosus TaxID=182803 RepID=A0A4Y2DW26_ARAVE|nr:hypothetical protein AVEN_200785-1 [Araneus ventricosus]